MELRKALQETSDQALVNTHTTAEVEVAMCKQLQEAQSNIIPIYTNTFNVYVNLS